MTTTIVTPGPWQAKQLTYSAGWVVLWPSAAGQHMKRIDRAGEFTEGDARLIAAAPELLEVLRHIEGAASDITCDRAAIKAAARSAIKKATGA